MGIRSQRRRGFHTLELISAMAIAVVVMGIGFSGFRIYNKDMPVRGEGRQLVHALGTARALAIARNSFHAFRINLDEGNYWVDEVADPLDPLAPPIPDGTKRIEPEGVDSRVRVEGTRTALTLVQTTGIQSVVFAPDGSADVDFYIYLYQAGTDPAVPGNVHTVRVYGPSGLAKHFPRERL